MWLGILLVGIVFFILGQIVLRYDKQNDILLSSSCFFIASGILGLIVFVYYHSTHKASNSEALSSGPIISKLGLLAGVLFFCGNFLWIYSIQNAPSLSLVRIIMAGIETILLTMAGHILFQQQIHAINIVGYVTVLIGVYLSLQ